jgi:hypothetical protein
VKEQLPHPERIEAHRTSHEAEDPDDTEKAESFGETCRSGYWERRNTMASLQSRLDDFKHTFESGGPPYNAPREAIETMHRATAELKASGVESHALKAGDHAPEFTLFNQNHFEVSSADLLRQGPLVVSFFRGHW